MADNVAIVEQMYADFGAGDVPAVLARLDDGIEWYEAEGNPYWKGAPAVGPGQVVEQVLAPIPQDFDGFAIRVGRIVGLGDTVLVEARYAATGKSTGRTLDAQVAHVWDLRDGKVVRFQQYVDTAQLRQVLGVGEPA